MTYNAEMLRIEYDEDGIRYEEIFVSIIENWGQLGAGMWGNKETFYLRTLISHWIDYI